jgi:DNA-binding transcriptional MerR regulator/methylmalonyl-CoA mutase cobalamin-binding subunit
MQDSQAKYGIGTVVRLTGLSPDVIRAWERRYRIITPQRSQTERRLYTGQDVERLTLLKRVTEAGHRIGHVAGLGLETLHELVQADRQSVTTTPPPSHQKTVSPVVDAVAVRYLAACTEAVRETAPLTLEATLQRAALDLSVPVLLDQVLTPLLRNVGDDWQEGRIRVGQEHIASAQIRLFLGNLLAAYNTNPSGPVFLAATLAGHLHELGALMVSITAATDGWNVIYVGGNLPALEIAALASRLNARMVGISVVYPADDPRFSTELGLLKRHLPGEVPLVVGGSAAPAYRRIIEQAGGVCVDSLAEFRTRLDSLRIKKVQEGSETTDQTRG